MLTIDASVMVAAAVADEPNHDVAAALLREAGRSRVAIHQPTVALVEVAAGIVRRTADVGLAQDALRLLLAMPGAEFHGLDMPAALQAAGVASALRVRAGDAAYAAVALEAGSTLVTLNHELLARAAPLVDACTLAAWIARAGEGA